MTPRRPYPGRDAPTGADQRAHLTALPAPTDTAPLTSAVGGRAAEGTPGTPTGPCAAPGGWLTIPEVCAILKLDPASWQTWHEQTGDMPLRVVTPDGAHLVRPADLARWLDARTVEPTAEPTPDDIAQWHAMRDADGGPDTP